jgi:hypothetical protein
LRPKNSESGQVRGRLFRFLIRGDKIMTSQSLMAGAAALVLSGPAAAAPDDRAVVAEMDVAYQAAVKRNDLAAMDRILHPDFVLVRPARW